MCIHTGCPQGPEGCRFDHFVRALRRFDSSASLDLSTTVAPWPPLSATTEAHGRQGACAISVDGHGRSSAVLGAMTASAGGRLEMPSAARRSCSLSQTHSRSAAQAVPAQAVHVLVCRHALSTIQRTSPYIWAHRGHNYTRHNGTGHECIG